MTAIHHTSHRESTTSHGASFTLLEVLVVISILTLLMGILLPSLSRARQEASAIACGSNIRQLAAANGMYAQDNGGRLVPGAAGIAKQNLHRWHGLRMTIQSEFDPTRGPLVSYLGAERAIRRCPSFQPERRGFEFGSGGYGYNDAYLGVETVLDHAGRTIIVTDLAGTWADRIARPGDTLMFADTAFAAEALIEYSFAEPRFQPQWGSRADPSIHFRHAASANIAWADGHVSLRRRTFTWSSGLYAADPDRLGLGWFGATDDNSMFDIR